MSSNLTNSVFNVFDLGVLKGIFRRNNLECEGRRNWRKSYISVLEKKSYTELLLEESEFQSLILNSNQIKEYKIVKISDNGLKTKRKREEDEFEEDEQPEKKKRKFSEQEGVLLAEYLTNNYPNYKNEVFKRILYHKSDEENETDPFLSTLDFLSSQENVSNDKKTVLKLLKDFSNEISVGDIISNSNSIEELKILVQERYVEKLCPVVSNFTEKYFKPILNDSDETKDYVNSNFLDGFSVNSKFFDGLFENNICVGDKNTSEPSSSDKIKLIFRDTGNNEVVFQMKKNTRLTKAFSAYAKMKKISMFSLVFQYDEIRLDFAKTPSDYELEDGDVVDVFQHQSGGKPVILLYPKKNDFLVEKVVLKLNKEKWKLKCWYPKNCCCNGVDIVQWENMIVNKNGEFRYNNLDYRYLFWESTSVVKFDFFMDEKIYLVKKSDLINFLVNVLKSKKMKEFDIHDFITYWLPKLEKFEYNLIQFYKKNEYEKLTQLEIVPKPDYVVKIFMLFAGFNQTSELVVNEEVIIEKDLTKIEDEKENIDLCNNFVCFEWGGYGYSYNQID